MKFALKVWRQHDANAAGSFVDYEIDGITADMSFLEMIDALNEKLLLKGEDPITFEHDCREGICGSCGFLIHDCFNP